MISGAEDDAEEPVHHDEENDPKNPNLVEDELHGGIEVAVGLVDDELHVDIEVPLVQLQQ